MGLVIALNSLGGCGGSQVNFDEFVPRAATSDDFAGTKHSFSWLPLGNPLFSSVNAFDLNLSVISSENSGTFVLTERASSVRFEGTYLWSSPNLQLTVSTSGDTARVAVGAVVSNTLDADVADGRIRFRSLTSTSEVTSDPE